tara:strand:- start:437 stop:784 length:348 start_codon:yes stop_codon:yes gene_type:complete
MKTKKFIKKVGRFLELADEFEKEAIDIFGEDNNPKEACTYSFISDSASGSSADFVTFSVSDFDGIVPKTRGEMILETLEIKIQEEKRFAEKADRYDEYLNLKIELEEYINLISKI